MATKKESASIEKNELFVKQQFLSSKQFSSSEKDLLHALLVDGEVYTTDQVKKTIRDFLNKEAK